METKPRRRVANKMQHQKNQADKKKAREHREVRAVSRKERSYVRSQIDQFPKTYYTDQPYRRVLIILHDSVETDRILFQVNNIGKGNLYLALPIMNEEDLGLDAKKDIESWMQAVKDYARVNYGVEPSFVHEASTFVLLSNCKFVEPISGLSPITVRPFERWHWDYFEDVAFLDGGGTGMYSGKQIKEYFQVHGDLAKVYLRHETLEVIFQYRLLSGRMTEFHDEEPQQGGEQNAG